MAILFRQFYLEVAIDAGIKKLGKTSVKKDLCLGRNL